MPAPADLLIRDAHSSEFAALGQLMVLVYSGLPGFPSPLAQPAYYDMLANIGDMARKPGARLLVAVSGASILGGVVYFADMAHYGSGGAATQQQDSSGFRLLAVDPAARGRGVGRALVQRCIELARERAHAHLILHTTRSMQVAWRMYEDLGFRRSPDLDFMQGDLAVFGFRLRL